MAWVHRVKELKATNSLDGILKLKKALKDKSKDCVKYFKVPMDMMKSAEDIILQQAQYFNFSSEIQCLQDKEWPLPKTSSIVKLDPFLEDGLLKVGGRLSRCNIPHSAKHQVLIPKDSPVSKFIIEEFHRQVGHLGANVTVAAVRQQYWIVGVRALTKALVFKCVICRKLQARVSEQKMGDLPKERFSASEPPFTNTGIDYFGPFEVKRGRVTLKRYGVIFTCMTSRAVHLEVAHSLNTDSCINALRRFIARRGQVRHIQSDNGTNFVGSNRELKEELEKWNQKQIHDFLLQRGIKWESNPPAGSHFGGIWERMIRSVRKILQALLQEQSIHLDDENLHTLFCEVESILNGRPITELSDDPCDQKPITPNQILLLQSGENFPPGIFERNDNYARRRWRQVQYLADVFWKRWTKEYLPLLQECQKWTRPRRNVSKNDLVLVSENSPRNSWALARVLEVYPDRKGFVRSVKLRTKTGDIHRPIDKLCIVLECD